MKKKMIALLLCASFGMIFNACGSKEAKTEGTEAVNEAGTETVSAADIEYKVDDYVTLGEYMDVEVTLSSQDYVVDDAAVNDYADKLIAYTKPYVPDTTKTTVAKGDVVDVDYVGKLNGEAFEGGSAEAQMIDTSNNTNATAGNGYIEGFSDGLVGANVGDTVDSQVTFPEDYGVDDLNGQTVTFTFTVNSINTKMTRENIDEAFVKENFEKDSIQAFYDDIRTYLTEQKESDKKNDIRSAVIDAVANKCTVDKYPEGLLEAKVEEYVANMIKQYCSDGTSLADYLSKTYNTTEEQFRSDVTNFMKDSLKQELVFEAIAKEEKIKFDEDGFNTYMTNLVQNGGFESEDAVYKNYGSNAESGKEYLKKIYLENKACELVADKAVVKYTDDTAGTETTGTETAVPQEAGTEK